MKFVRYSSIENAYNQKQINHIYDHGFALDDGTMPYIVTEKVHGANFGIHMDVVEGTLEYSKRSSMIGDSNFMGHLSVIDSLRGCCDRLHQAIGSKVKESIEIHAEIYGGDWFGDKTNGATTVQKGSSVKYAPGNHVACFDMKVDGKFVAPIESMVLLHASGFPMVPIIGVFNSLREALECGNIFNSFIPERHLLKAEGDNPAEGVVIQPFNRTREMNNGKRVILKNVNPNFRENNGSARGPAAPKVLSEHVQGLLQVTTPYLNENRLSHVMSKDEYTQKDFGKVLGLLVQDALEDYVKECTSMDAIKELKEINESADWQSFNREFNKIASQVVRPVWAKQFA